MKKEVKPAEAQAKRQDLFNLEFNSEEQQDKLYRLISSGLWVSKAEFQSAVNNGANTPENMFSEKSENHNRRAKMWLTQVGLVCLQGQNFFGCPSANLKYFHFKSTV